MLTTNQTMSSREIAELTGKRHDHVLRDCDSLNENYQRLTLPKIEEGYYTHPNTGKQQHREYLLSRMQTFDLMTGYNTELRIKVNRRWEELESRSLIDFTNPDTVLMLAQNWKNEQLKRIEAEQEKEKLLQISAIQEDVIVKQAPKVEYHDKVLLSEGLILTNTIADELGISAKKLNAILHQQNVIYKQNGTYMLYARYRGMGLEKYKTHPYTDGKGNTVTSHLLCWTESGRKFIHELVSKLSISKKAA